MREDDKNQNTNFSVDESGSIKKDTQSEFEIKNTWIPDRAKKNYHEQRLSQSKWAFRLSFWASIVGFCVIIKSLSISLKVENIQWPGIVSGTVIEAVAALFYTLSNKANEKISEFFKELTKDSNVKDALKLIDKISDDGVRDELLVKISLHLSGIDEEKICKKTREICDEKK